MKESVCAYSLSGSGGEHGFGNFDTEIVLMMAGRRNEF